MSARRFWQLCVGWFTVYRGAVLVSLGVPLAFVGMHLLGRGQVEEIGYTLLLLAFALGYAALHSFVRYAARQMRLWDALVHLPPEPEALPEAATEPERGFRALSAAYQQAQSAASAATAAAERERLDYFTLWVHQIKTPISALDLLAQSPDPVDRELLRQEVFKIGQYAEMALSFQRLRSLHGDLSLTDVPLFPLCASLVKKLRPIFLYRHIRLQMEPFDAVALSDAKWLGLAVMQVLTNALKYTPEGGQITIGLSEPLVLVVRDTGVGIRAEDLPRVFEFGFTGHQGHDGASGDQSTGIGLYLCKQVCDQLGHDVRLSSTPGAGTTVRFDLRRERYQHFD